MKASLVSIAAAIAVIIGTRVWRRKPWPPRVPSQRQLLCSRLRRVVVRADPHIAGMEAAGGTGRLKVDGCGTAMRDGLLMSGARTNRRV